MRFAVLWYSVVDFVGCKITYTYTLHVLIVIEFIYKEIGKKIFDFIVS